MKRVMRKFGTVCTVILAAAALALAGCSDGNDSDDGQNTEQGAGGNGEDAGGNEEAGGETGGSGEESGGEESGGGTDADGDGTGGGEDATDAILDAAQLKGTINGWVLAELTKESDTVYTYEFTADADSGQFTVLRTSDQADGGWGDETITIVAPAASADGEGDISEAVSLIHKESDYPGNINLSGLSANSTYTLTFTVGDAAANAVSATITLKEYVAPPTSYSLEGLTLKGSWEGSWAEVFTLTDAPTQTYETTVGAHDASGNEFGIFRSSNEWYAEAVPYGERTELQYASSGGGNATMASNWEVGATYTIKVELADDSLDSPRLFITVTKNE